MSFLNQSCFTTKIIWFKKSLLLYKTSFFWHTQLQSFSLSLPISVIYDYLFNYVFIYVIIYLFFEMDLGSLQFQITVQMVNVDYWLSMLYFVDKDVDAFHATTYLFSVIHLWQLSILNSHC